MSFIQLREHQVDANSRIRKWVGFPARSIVPEQGARATVVSATGSGKTYTAAVAALNSPAAGAKRSLVRRPVAVSRAARAISRRRTVAMRRRAVPMGAICSQADRL